MNSRYTEIKPGWFRGEVWHARTKRWVKVFEGPEHKLPAGVVIIGGAS